MNNSFNLGRRKFLVAGIAGVASTALDERPDAQAAVPARNAGNPVESKLWAKNVILCYMDPPGNGGKEWTSAFWQAENFRWVLAQCDLQGAPSRPLFDGFLFMAYNFKERALLPLKDRKPGTADDWNKALDLYLRSAESLSRCQGEVTHALGQTGRLAKVIFAVPYPDARNRAFGPIGGKTLDFTMAADRETSVRWFIDEALARWRKLEGKKKLDNVRLTGFYWFRESILKNYPAKRTDDPALVRAFCRHVHSKGLLAYWIPALAQGKHLEPWHEWGFDCVAQQINYVNADPRGRSLVTFDDCTLVARTMGLDGVQINFSNRKDHMNPRLWNWRQQALANLEAALRLNWKSFPCTNYFNANEIVSIGRDPNSREYYEALSRWVEGALTYAEVDAMCDRLAQEMRVAGQISDVRLARIKATNKIIVLIPTRAKLSLMEKPPTLVDSVFAAAQKKNS